MQAAVAQAAVGGASKGHTAARPRGAPARPLRPARMPTSARAFMSATLSNSDTLADALAALRPPPLAAADAVLLEGFGWDSCKGQNWWRTLRAQIPNLAAAGVTHVWLPPPSQSVSSEGYLPGQLYSLDSKYGTEAELRALCADLLAAGMRPVADIVINHRCADEQDSSGAWTVFTDKVPHPGRSIAWGRWAITCNDPAFRGEGAPDSGEDFGPAPDLDHTNPEVRESLTDWLAYLALSVGFEGFRFDFVKGYAPHFVREYIERTIGPDAFAVGEWFPELRWQGSTLEYCQDDARHRMRNWIREARCGVFDFVAKGQLQEAVKHHEFDRLRDGAGKASGMIGWCPESSVTFVDNHDTGYAYILTHPGIPCIMHEHLGDGQLKQTIQELVAIRKRAGLRAGSPLEILAAEKDMYVARCGGRVTLKLGPRYDMGGLVPQASDGWRMAAKGTDFAVWEKA